MSPEHLNSPKFHWAYWHSLEDIFVNLLELALTHLPGVSARKQFQNKNRGLKSLFFMQ